MESQPRGAPPPPPAAEDPVYRLAGSLGSELQRLSALVGPGAVSGLVAQVVLLLELLEAWAQEKPGLRDAAAAEQQQQQQGQAEREGSVRRPEEEQQEQQQPSSPRGGESALLQKEREVMLRLKEVVDRQRDQIRAQDHQIRCKARDTEALQEQLERFMAMNQELHRKLAVAQAQLRSALERKQDLEGELRQAQALQGDRAQAPPPPQAAQAEESPASPGDPGPAGNAFSREELRQVLQERTELKTSLFLVQEELAYYQRELLNHGRIPSLLLEAVKANVRRQRKKIRAKMLGTAEEEPLSSEDEGEEEEGDWLAGTPGPSDCVDSRLPGSTIKSFFGQWYGRGSKGGSPPDAWEIVDPQELGLPREEEPEKPQEGGGGREGHGGPPAPP